MRKQQQQQQRLQQSQRNIAIYSGQVHIGQQQQHKQQQLQQQQKKDLMLRQQQQLQPQTRFSNPLQQASTNRYVSEMNPSILFVFYFHNFINNFNLISKLVREIINLIKIILLNYWIHWHQMSQFG